VFTRRSATEVATAYQNAAVLKAFPIERVIGILLTIVFESVLADSVERNASQKASGDDPIRIDIVEK
jgi:hypothetical protein